MHLLPLILYACAAGAYLAHFAGRDRSVGVSDTTGTTPPLVWTTWRKRAS